MPVAGRYWGIGIAAAVLVHAAIAVFIFWQPAAPGAREAGLRGVEVGLGTAGRAPGSAVETADTPETEAVSRSETAADATPRETSAPQPESVTAQPVEETVTAEPETTESQPVEETVSAEPETTESQPVEETVSAEPETTESQPVEETVSAEPETIESRPVEEQEVTVAPPDSSAPRAVDQAATPQPESAPAREKELSATTAPASAGAGGESGSRAAADSGSGEDTSGGGTPGASADYMARLRAWLEKHKQYPRRAQMRRQEGTALLRFVVDREGRVLEYTIHESSGYEILDEEVVAMIERARPLPGMPDEMRRRRLELVVPVQFRLM